MMGIPIPQSPLMSRGKSSLHRNVLALLAVLMAALAMPAQAQQPATALFLVASERIQNPLFRGAVILVTRHGRSRPLGVVINKPLATEQAPADTDLRLKPYYGGPVAPRQLIVVYRSQDQSGQGALALGEGLYMSFESRRLDDLLKVQPRLDDLRIFVGYAGWANGQLEDEIARGDWFVAPVEADAIFLPDPARLWEELVKKASRQGA